jgi:hypothetical protein
MTFPATRRLWGFLWRVPQTPQLPPDPEMWKAGVCTMATHPNYGCGCQKCYERMIDDLTKLTETR